MEKVEILMATYNGDQYIEQQLYSLLAQTYKNWRLIIHDDGSNDRTVDIIRYFASIDERIVMIEDGLKFGSAAKNFMYLLQKATAHFIAFCDQDDIWFDSKLEQLLGLIKNEVGPAAAYCNAYAYNGKFITADKVTLFERSNLKDCLFLNSGVQGCSMIFNEDLLKKVQSFPVDSVVMHDHLITISAVSFGKLLSSDCSLMLYRQHDKNVTGNVPTGLLTKVVNSFKHSKPVLDKDHYLANKAFYSTFESELNIEAQNLFRAYLNYPYVRLLTRIGIILKNKFRIGRNSLLLLVKTLIRKPI